MTSRYDRAGFLTHDEARFISENINAERKEFISADNPIKDILKNIFDYECIRNK